MTGTGQVPFLKPVFGKHIVTADTYGRDNQRRAAAKGISACFGASIMNVIAGLPLAVGVLTAIVWRRELASIMMQTRRILTSAEKCEDIFV